MKDTGMVPILFNTDIDVSKKPYGKYVTMVLMTDGIYIPSKRRCTKFFFQNQQKYANNQLPGMIMGVGSATERVKQHHVHATWSTHKFSL
jgi:hypothetical protein